MAAIHYFLDLDGIEGESTDAAHKGQIDVAGFSWGANRPGAPPGGGAGGGAGKATVEDLVVVKRLDKASPRLFLACATGQRLKQGVLSCRRAGTSGAEFLVVRLTDVVVTSYEVDGSDDERPVDQVAFAFARIEIEYRPTDRTGKHLPPVTVGWDLAKNAGV